MPVSSPPARRESLRNGAFERGYVRSRAGIWRLASRDMGAHECAYCRSKGYEMGSVARQYSGSTSSRSYSLFPGLSAGVAICATQRLAIVGQLRRPSASGRAYIPFIAQLGGHAGPPLRRHARRDDTLDAEKRCRGRPTCLPGVREQVVLQHRPF